MLCYFHVGALLSSLASPFIGLPQGLSYSARLYDPLTIPLLFGSDPQLDILDSAIEIRFIRTSGGPSPPDPMYWRLSPYRARISYSLAPNSIQGDFSLEIRVTGGLTETIGGISVTVTRKSGVQ